MPATALTAAALAEDAEDAVAEANLTGAVQLTPVPGGVEVSHPAGRLGAAATTRLIDAMDWAGLRLTATWREGRVRVLAFDA